MNTAYKWYSHNNSIIQFYSGDSSKFQKCKVDCVEETTEQSSYDYAANIVIPSDVNISGQY